MTFKTLALATLLVATGTAFAQKDDHSVKHGGIFIETKALDFEVVARPDLLQVYPRDHGKQVRLDGAQGKMTLLNGTEKTEVALTPVGDRLEAKGSYKVVKGTKGIASVTLVGKPAVLARFEVK